jgi:hypothetical protein
MNWQIGNALHALRFEWRYILLNRERMVYCQAIGKQTAGGVLY